MSVVWITPLLTEPREGEGGGGKGVNFHFQKTSQSPSGGGVGLGKGVVWIRLYPLLAPGAASRHDDAGGGNREGEPDAASRCGTLRFGNRRPEKAPRKSAPRDRRESSPPPPTTSGDPLPGLARGGPKRQLWRL